MAFVHGKVTEVYANQLVISNYLKSVSLSQSYDTHDTTYYGKSAKTYIPGLFSGGLSCDGYLDISSGASDEFCNTALANTSLTAISIFLSGSAVGNNAKLFVSNEKKADKTTPISDVAALSLEYEASNMIYNGFSLAQYSASTATVTGNVVDLGASGNLGAIANLHITAVSGTTPSMTVKVQHSTTSGGTYVDLMTFTAATGATSQSLEVAGNVNQFVRVIKTISGTTPSFTSVISFAKK